MEHDDGVSGDAGPARATRSTLRATFVVGCDGAHSTVRHLLNLPFEGAEYDASFMLADVQTNDALPADELQLCPSEFGPVAIFPMSATRRRIVATVDHPEGDAPSLELVRKILARTRTERDRGAGAALEQLFPHPSPAGCSSCASDASSSPATPAHIHSPFGGQGMNTGLHDVWNLAWKLDLVSPAATGTNGCSTATAPNAFP